MSHWPEWGMPVGNWQQQGSYVSPIEEALPDPAAGTLVCIPPLNPALLKYIAGCLDQLRNPSTYAGLSDADIALSLQRADTLRGMVGHPVACDTAMYEVRLQDCVLQQSTDGGATWTEVPGWADFPACLPAYQQQAIALPSNPHGVSTTQQACNIAGFVSQQMIQQIINVLKTDISTGQTVTQFLINLTAGGKFFIKVLPITGAVLLAVDALFTWAGSLASSDLTAIAADAVLWEDVTCAIYNGIKADGRITAGNWPTAVSNIRGISYSIPGVAGALADFAGALDMTTVYEWQQLAPIDSVDCSSCPGPEWCQMFDFTLGADLGWSSASGNGTWVGNQWDAIYNAPYTSFDLRYTALSYTPANITHVVVDFFTDGTASASWMRSVSSIGTGHAADLPLGSGAIHADVVFNATVDDLRVVAYTDGFHSQYLTKVRVYGTGSNPFTTGAAC